MEGYMTFVPVTNQKEITFAFETISNNWEKTALNYKKIIGFQGRQEFPEYKEEKTVYYRPQEKIWAYFEPNIREQNKYIRHYFFAGLSIYNTSVNIDSQFVVAAEGYKRTLGGVFLQDNDGHQYLGHTGKIGGGVKGVSRTPFMEHCKLIGVRTGYTDNAVCIVYIKWPDGEYTEGFCIARITSDQLPQRVYEFTTLRLDFRQQVIK